MPGCIYTYIYIHTYIHMQAQTKRDWDGKDGHGDIETVFETMWIQDEEYSIMGCKCNIMPFAFKMCWTEYKQWYVEFSWEKKMNVNAQTFTKKGQTNQCARCEQMVEESDSMEEWISDRWCTCSSSNKSPGGWGGLLSSQAAVAGPYLRGEPLGVAMP